MAIVEQDREKTILEWYGDKTETRTLAILPK